MPSACAIACGRLAVANAFNSVVWFVRVLSNSRSFSFANASPDADSRMT